MNTDNFKTEEEQLPTPFIRKYTLSLLLSFTLNIILFFVLVLFVFNQQKDIVSENTDVNQIVELKESGQEEDNIEEKDVIYIGDDGENLYLRVGDDVSVNEKLSFKDGVINADEYLSDKSIVWEKIKLWGFDSEKNIYNWSSFSRIPGKRSFLFTANQPSPSHSGVIAGQAIYIFDLDNPNAYGYRAYGIIKPIFTMSSHDFYPSNSNPRFVSWSPSGKYAQIELYTCFECDSGSPVVTVVIEVEKIDFIDRLSYKNIGHVKSFNWLSDDEFSYTLSAGGESFNIDLLEL
jgi:hypothetical protein